MRRVLVAGNWKMHKTPSEARVWFAELKRLLPPLQSEAAVLPAFPILPVAKEVLAETQVGYGAQDVSAHKEGAYTGEVSARMLSDLGCRYAIVGHSERRRYHGETDALVAAKFVAAQSAGLVPILCVGETLAERDAGQTEAVVGRQLQAVVAAAAGKDGAGVTDSHTGQCLCGAVKFRALGLRELVGLVGVVEPVELPHRVAQQGGVLAQPEVEEVLC